MQKKSSAANKLPYKKWLAFIKKVHINLGKFPIFPPLFSLARPGRKNSGTPVVTPDSGRSGRSRSRIGGTMGGSSASLSQPGSR